MHDDSRVERASQIIPTNLAYTASWNADVDEWLRRIPVRVEELKQQLSLEVGRPFEPGGFTSWVAPARLADGTDAVLKILWPHTEAEHEADALRLWDGRGTVRLFHSITTESAIVLLLERCHPGTLLRDAMPEPQSDGIVAALLRRLWIVPPDGHPFRSLSEMTSSWADELSAHGASRPHGVDPGLVREALQLMRDLPASATSSVLLATDLHAANVLAAQREPWLVIDPKPYVGDPAYDPVQHILNCLERAAPDPHALIDRLARLTRVDAERLRLWLFVRCVQASVAPGYVWPHTREIAARIAP